MLHGVSLGIADRERVGVVGRNGAGKMTSLTALAGLEVADSGRVARAVACESACLNKADALDPAAIARDVVLGVRREHDWAAHRSLREIMATLLRDDTLDREVGTLSGAANGAASRWLHC